VEKIQNQEATNQLFGNVHTLKGSAFTVNFQIIGDLVHTVEDYLDAVRHGRLEITASSRTSCYGRLMSCVCCSNEMSSNCLD
jgi:chemotaxis protein histidine kinase CheA